jgi:ketosteroid isomerase-like protein
MARTDLLKLSCVHGLYLVSRPVGSLSPSRLVEVPSETEKAARQSSRSHSRRDVIVADPRSLAETYFRSWKEQDFETLRSVLADDVTFRGPLGRADGADECIAGLQGMAPTVADIVVLKRLVDGPDVVSVFELHTEHAPPCLTANWSHVENGKIASIRTVFDPRPLLP